MRALLLEYCLCTVAATAIPTAAVLGQTNLIPNWSFEELRWPDSEFPCPSSGGGISLTNYWGSAHGSVDYFNSCSNEDWSNFGVPNNQYGYQNAFEGEAYGHLAAYSIFFDNAREYLWMELPDSLKSGQGYLFKCHVSLADSVNFAVANIGALFTSVDTRFLPIDSFIVAKPQVESPDSFVLEEKENWMEISGQFVAQGGEKYMTIGVFRSEDQLTVQQVSSHPPLVNNWDASSYLIDGVELYEDNSIGIAEQEQEVFNLWPNPTDGQVNLSYEVQEAQKLMWEVTDITGRRVHLQPLQGNAGKAILGVRLPAGVYISNLIANDLRIGSRRLVVL
jgi:hypothetical protein